MTGWLRHSVPQAGSQSLLAAAAGAAALLQRSRPGPTSYGEKPLFLVAGWVESAYGDVLGASEQDIVNRAVYSEAEVWGVEKEEHLTLFPKPHPERTFFFFFPKMLNVFRASRLLVCVPLGDCGWQTWVSCDFPVEPYLLYEQLLQGLRWSL